MDVRVKGPFKGKLRMAQHDWMTANPGKVITIHDLASLTNAVNKLLLLQRIQQNLLLSLVCGHSQDLPSVMRIVIHHLLRLWKKNFVTKRSLFLLLAPL